MEKNFNKMMWSCRSCELSDDPRRSQNFKKPLHCFNVRSPADFVNKLLPQGQWTRCTSCQHEKKGEFGKLGGSIGGSTNNTHIEERSLAASQACEECEQCGRSLTRANFWPVDWRHRMTKDRSIKCKECCPKPPNERLSGYAARTKQKSIEAAAKPITCQVCERSLPRSQFRKNSRNKFDFRKGMTCEQCRADGKLPTAGWKKRRIA